MADTQFVEKFVVSVHQGAGDFPILVLERTQPLNRDVANLLDPSTRFGFSVHEVSHLCDERTRGRVDARESDNEVHRRELAVMEKPPPAVAFHRPKKVVLLVRGREDRASGGRCRRVDRARAPLHRQLDLKRLARNLPRVDRTASPVDGAQRRDGDGGRGSEPRALRERGADLEPQRRRLARLLDRGLHVRVPRVVDRTAVREPLVMRSRVHLCAQVDGGGERRLPEDDGVFAEEDQLAGRGTARHVARMGRDAINVS